MQILAGLILLAVLIVFHELGHFIFAKILGVKVEVFSLGFGPKLLGFRYGDTEYRISAIPLGGYVRMFGESLEEDLSPEQKKQSFMHQAIWRKSLIAVAGPLFNFILPIILFFFLLYGTEQVFSPVVGTLIKDSVAEKAGLLPDDRIEAINGHKIDSFNNLAQLISEHPNQKLKLLIKRPSLTGFNELSLSLVPEAKPSLSPMEKSRTVGRIGIMPSIEKPIIMVKKDSFLYNAGLRDFDEIKSVNNTPVASMYALQVILNKLPENSNIQIIRGDEELNFDIKTKNMTSDRIPPIKLINDLSKAEGAYAANKNGVSKTASLVMSEAMLWYSRGYSPAKGVIVDVKPLSTAAILGLETGDKIIAIDGEKISSDLQLEQNLLQDLKAPHILGVLTKSGQPQIRIFQLAKKLDEGANLDMGLPEILGIGTASVFKPGEAYTRNVGFFEAIKRAGQQTYAMGVLTVKSLWMLISGEVSASSVGGPIMIFDVAQKAAHKGLSYYIFIMCLLSVNLGLLNLLPIPALDGGHLLLFGIEAVQRRPLTMKTRAIAMQIGFALLLALMAWAIFNDLYRLFK